MGRANDKKMIQHALQEPERDLPPGLRERMSAEELKEHRIHRVLEEKLSLGFAEVSRRLDETLAGQGEGILQADVFRLRLNRALERSGSALPLARPGSVEKLRTLLGLNSGTLLRYVPVALLLLLVLPLLPFLQTKTDKQGERETQLSDQARLDPESLAPPARSPDKSEKLRAKTKTSRPVPVRKARKRRRPVVVSKADTNTGTEIAGGNLAAGFPADETAEDGADIFRIQQPVLPDLKPSKPGKARTPEVRTFPGDYEKRLQAAVDNQARLVILREAEEFYRKQNDSANLAKVRAAIKKISKP